MFNLTAIFTAILLCCATAAVADENLRDPTRPLGHVATNYQAKENTLRLQSVLISDARKVAYINGQQLREQDTIKGTDNIKVLRIETDGVELQQGNRRWRLDLNKVSIRR